MEWFKKSKSGILGKEKKAIKDNLWVKCEVCKEIIFKKELDKSLGICTSCNAHFRIHSKEYREIIFDKNSFHELDATISPLDPLSFVDKKKYSDRIIENQKKTGLKDAVVTGLGTIEKRKVALAVMDFRFMGGSMGSVVGEKITRMIRRATRDGLAVIIVSASGGARMQEGAYSLMQMAKTSNALALHSLEKLPYISVLTHPTTGGTTASFAMLGDVNIAEPGALIGFAGPRVIRETIRQELPEGFQRADFLLKHGFIDLIVDRKELKKTLATLLEHFSGESNKEKVAKTNLFVDAKGNLKKDYQPSRTKPSSQER